MSYRRTLTPRLFYNCPGLQAEYVDPIEVDLEIYSTQEEVDEYLEEVFEDFAGEAKIVEYDDVPHTFIKVGRVIDDALWDWLALDDEHQHIAFIYLTEVDDIELDRIWEQYLGHYSCAADWAEVYLADIGSITDDISRRYFDYERYADDARHDGIEFVNMGRGVYVFDTNL